MVAASASRRLPVTSTSSWAAFRSPACAAATSESVTCAAASLSCSLEYRRRARRAAAAPRPATDGGARRASGRRRAVSPRRCAPSTLPGEPGRAAAHRTRPAVREGRGVRELGLPSGSGWHGDFDAPPHKGGRLCRRTCAASGAHAGARRVRAWQAREGNPRTCIRAVQLGRDGRARRSVKFGRPPHEVGVGARPGEGAVRQHVDARGGNRGEQRGGGAGHTRPAGQRGWQLDGELARDETVGRRRPQLGKEGRRLPRGHLGRNRQPAVPRAINRLRQRSLRGQSLCVQLDHRLSWRHAAEQVIESRRPAVPSDERGAGDPLGRGVKRHPARGGGCPLLRLRRLRVLETERHERRSVGKGVARHTTLTQQP
eukprot:scaffold17869_cov104-Isochrysis_galbana.AAC.3